MMEVSSMALPMRTTLTWNQSNFEKGVRIAQQKVGFGTAGILAEEAKVVMEMSKRQVPKDTHSLVSTAFVTPRRQRGPVSKVEFGYSGQARNPKTGQMAYEYLIAVHEDLTKHHPNGKAKFLEDPLREYAQQAGSSIGHRLQILFK